MVMSYICHVYFVQQWKSTTITVLAALPISLKEKDPNPALVPVHVLKEFQQQQQQHEHE